MLKFQRFRAVLFGGVNLAKRPFPLYVKKYTKSALKIAIFRVNIHFIHTNLGSLRAQDTAHRTPRPGYCAL